VLCRRQVTKIYPPFCKKAKQLTAQTGYQNMSTIKKKVNVHYHSQVNPNKSAILKEGQTADCANATGRLPKDIHHF
jgi:hypothetical protein